MTSTLILAFLALVFVPGAFLSLRYPFAAPSIIACLAPFHLILLLLLYNGLGLSTGEINIAASWKELLIFATLGFCAVRWVQMNALSAMPLRLLDIAFLSYLLVNVAYIPASFMLHQMNASAAAVLNGFRIQAMMPLAYFAARACSSVKVGNIDGFLKLLTRVGTLLAVVALIEVVVDPVPTLNALGLKRYLVQVGGMYDVEFTSEGVPLTYFAHFDTERGGALRWRRSASLLLSPLSFSQTLLITVPIALMLALRKRVSALHVLLQAGGLVASISRGPIVAAIAGCAGMLLLSGAVSRKTRRRALFVVVLLAAIVCYAGVEFIRATLSMRDPSAISRAGVYASSIEFILGHPFGVGLAASEQKFTEERVGGGESEYLEIASRIGWAGLAVFLLLNAVIIKLAMKGCRGHDRTLAMLSTIVLGITICIVIEQVVNRVWRHPFLPFEFAWVIGAWSTYYYLSSRQGRNPALARCD